ncbi:hypothetical protein [Yersinia massiliensis]|uniref:hypothetical protein n=1 Tax=Yersinia massiliensis TaxID=419257 RepID=UPI0003001685|nr:hypothetical protein [Yersinia massiliensis]QKJ09347.1 hypothetical protein HRD68_00610 [Yersinia massiliensis]
MFVSHQRFMTTENQLQDCQQLLASRSDELECILAAAKNGSGIYKRILECREMAERVRRLMPSTSCRDSLMLLDHLAYMDGWLTHLAKTLPLDTNAGLLEKTALAGNVAMIYLVEK